MDNVDAETKTKIEALLSAKGVPKRKKKGIGEYIESYGTDNVKNKFDLIVAAILKLYPEALDPSQRIIDEFTELKYSDLELLKLISQLVDWKTKGESLALVNSQLSDVSIIEESEPDLLDNIE